MEISSFKNTSHQLCVYTIFLVYILNTILWKNSCMRMQLCRLVNQFVFNQSLASYEGIFQKTKKLCPPFS